MSNILKLLDKAMITSLAPFGFAEADDLKFAEATDQVCSECYGGGGVQVYSEHPPCFGECEKCFNQNDYPSP